MSVNDRTGAPSATRLAQPRTVAKAAGTVAAAIAQARQVFVAAYKADVQAAVAKVLAQAPTDPTPKGGDTPPWYWELTARLADEQVSDVGRAELVIVARRYEAYPFMLPGTHREALLQLAQDTFEKDVWDAVASEWKRRAQVQKGGA